MAVSPVSFYRLNKSLSSEGGMIATIGAFDGVHLGHQFLLAQLRKLKAKYKLPTVVILFEPQPKEFFAQKAGVVLKRITQFRDKVLALKALEVDQIVCVKFNEKLAQLSAEQFVESLLVKQLNIKHLMIGDDFKFGKNRQGDFTFLQKLGKLHHFSVLASKTFKQADNRVSSSLVRAALFEGDFKKAHRLLGRPFTVCNRVIHGEKLGRTLGFPTVNLALKQPFVLNGVYAVSVRLESDQRYFGAAHVGTRIAVGGRCQLLEVYLFDFVGDLYGQKLQVTFWEKIRGEQNFDSLEGLKRQIELDCERIRSSRYPLL